MKILLYLSSDSELINYESISLAFVLASFDHIVQLKIAPNVLPVLSDPNSRLYGMIQSLSLYDLPAAWVDDMALFSHLPQSITENLTQTPADLPQNPERVHALFDGVLHG